MWGIRHKASQPKNPNVSSISTFVQGGPNRSTSAFVFGLRLRGFAFGAWGLLAFQGLWVPES